VDEQMLVTPWTSRGFAKTHLSVLEHLLFRRLLRHINAFLGHWFVVDQQIALLPIGFFVFAGFVVAIRHLAVVLDVHVRPGTVHFDRFFDFDVRRCRLMV
jgi:hypothetical protein